MKTLKQRFYDKFVPVTESGCWLWTGSLVTDDYGQIHKDGKRERAHRVSYEIHIGQIPDGMVVMHKCDNPSCVNPEHLSIGSISDNAIDMVNKGRSHLAKINANIASAIRSALGTQKEIAKQYGVSQQTVSMIKRNLIWKEL